MPVKKSSTRKTTSRSVRTAAAAAKKTAQMEIPAPMHGEKHSCYARWCGGDFAHKILLTFIGILLVYLIVYVGALMRNEMKAYHYIGKADTMERSIYIEGEGSVEVVPNVANISMGVVSEAETVEEAQAENNEKMSALNARLAEIGIPESDIQTSNYNVFPQYEYTDDGRELVGYSVNQQADIRIADTALADSVVALAGELELNQVGQLSYDIGERDEYITQARQDALKKIGEKARVLSESLGVNIVGVMSYDEYEVSGDDYYYPYAASEGMMLDAVGGAKNLQAGTDEVKLHVSVTFEIR